MTETALDEFVKTAAVWGCSLDASVRQMLYGEHFEADFPGHRREILQDPRYIQHCKEQDRKEEGLSPIMAGKIAKAAALPVW